MNSIYIKFGLLFIAVQSLVALYFMSKTPSMFYIIYPRRAELAKEKLPIITENVTKLDQVDHKLVSFAKGYILPPSTQPYPFKNDGPTNIISSLWNHLQKLVPNGRNGVFVETGAYDGVAASNTLWLEAEQNWTGLLVECHPKSLESLKSNHRKSFVAQCCLSPSNHSELGTMTSVNEWNPASSLGSGNIFGDFKNFTKIKVPLFPMYTLLSAVEYTTIDFVSLDIQSQELKVLKNFPFHLILVKSWLIEVELLSEMGKEALIQLMVSNEFKLVAKVTQGDYFFLHESLLIKVLSAK